MNRWLIPLGASIPLALGAAAAAQEAPLDVVATIGMIADVAENVGGDCVSVTALMGPGVDPHLFQASAADVRALQDADVILYSGYALEGQLGEVLERFAETRPTVAVAPTSIEPSELIATQDLYGVDPHLWMDASLWSRIAPTIAATIAEARPDCAEAVEANAASYGEELAALHDWVTAAVASIPEAQRVLVTAHDAFAYFGRAYDIEVVGVQGISTEAEAAVADVRATVDLVVERQVPAVFVESTINARTVQAVTDAAQRRGHEVRIGGELYSDAMGETGEVGGTYIGMIFENTASIVEALGGDLPPVPDALAAWAEAWDAAAPE